jgi:hypothetical protein
MLMPNRATSDRERGRKGKARRALWYLVLVLVPLVGLLWVPFYNAVEPSWAGIPFFYWYQVLWVAITAALTGIVYAATK